MLTLTNAWQGEHSAPQHPLGWLSALVPRGLQVPLSHQARPFSSRDVTVPVATPRGPRRDRAIASTTAPLWLVSVLPSPARPSAVWHPWWREERGPLAGHTLGAASTDRTGEEGAKCHRVLAAGASLSHAHGCDGWDGCVRHTGMRRVQTRRQTCHQSSAPTPSLGRT